MNEIQLIEIEKIELKYLKKFYHFLKAVEDEMLDGFKTKDKIKDDWIKCWENDKHSDFDVGAERVVYALFNGKMIGLPNSAPVGSDLFFETKDAFIHIDMKTVEAGGNLGDYVNSIFIGENQNSYKSIIQKNTGITEEYEPNLPTFYNHGKSDAKICLTYFITILYEKKDIKILNINILSMPNGELSSYYTHRPLCAGKNHGKARFKFTETANFELLRNSNIDESRIRVVYLDRGACNKSMYLNKNGHSKLKFFMDIEDKQSK